MILTHAKHVHVVGIGGIGVSAIARWLHHLSIPVSGSDLKASKVTETLKSTLMSLSIGEHRATNVPAATDYLVYSPAIRSDNPERVEAKERGIPELSYPEALARLSAKYFTIAVAGTHGKTTTTAMLGAIFIAAGLDPVVVVGSLIPEWEGNFRFGQGKVCIIEADEYDRSFLAYSPDCAVVTNVDRDHLDTYRDIDDISQTFTKFIGQIKASGCVIINHDDENSRQLSIPAQIKRIEYSTKEISNCRPLDDEIGMQFETAQLGEVRISAPGLHMVGNALAAAAVATQYGISAADIKKGLRDYHGAWRRFEVIGERNGAVTISDYAHHPTEVRATIDAAKNAYPKSNVIFVFQPHQKRRVALLKDEFVDALSQAGTVALAEIYEVPGREDASAQSISSRELVRQLVDRRVAAEFLENKQEIFQYLESKSRSGNVIVCLGAGDVHSILLEFMSTKSNA